MAKNIVIVESPAKCKTIKKYLGKGFDVMASYGHMRDLIPKTGAVDPENDFAMTYQHIERNEKHYATIKKALKKADAIYLATDPDREGEAISWHLKEMLDEQKQLKGKEVFRVVFNEITKKAVNDAVANPRSLSLDLVDAQQARRALDYLVGFNLSPLLWKKIRRGLSAGRVQSPALRLICERENAIRAFEPKEYWSIEAQVEKDKQGFSAKLSLLDNEKVKQFTVTNEQQAHAARQALIKVANGELLISKVEKKQRRRNPSPPFTTSTLQQEAVRKLGFSASRTMRTAQQLYEGIDIGEGAVGLITYMRTDSVSLSDEALGDIRSLIENRYGKDNLPGEIRVFKTKSKNAQEAHEAVRPTTAQNIPEEIKKHLTSDQNKLYELIWKRTVACQMIHATLDTVAADLQANAKNVFRANGSSIKHAGFMAVYQEGQDDKKESDDKDKLLPPLEEGKKVKLNDVITNQHFTEPPPRFTEASLVKSLEEFGIGRPSTYASIISTLQQREYVEMDKRRFTPTEVGEIVNKFLTNYFGQYVDYEFTAKLEDELDAVARGEKEWIPLMREFWKPFIFKIDDTEANVSRKDVTTEALDEDCPTCGAKLEIKLGKRGRFIGCTKYPDCDYTRNLNEDANAEPETFDDYPCPECNSQLIIKTGRYGKFIGCSSYPDCKHIEPIEKPKETGVTCPTCKEGEMLQRRSRRGKIFYSCSRYPDCSYAVWNEPKKKACPDCGWPMLTEKTTKRAGTQLVCPQEGCGFTESVEKEDAEESDS